MTFTLLLVVKRDVVLSQMHVKRTLLTRHIIVKIT